ncbi:hypothetical protein BFG52_14025 [Acinetobacter larvae]|uniref:Uncharacterized protein n=1 Tax=Acinetobacter larvae TaxID=1789224 RepID=A0A1B2M2V7_9GAMM|nr:hypothetical protein BFG52_14025 [Acinetobacter larvae]
MWILPSAYLQLLPDHSDFVLLDLFNKKPRSAADAAFGCMLWCYCADLACICYSDFAMKLYAVFNTF